MKFFSICLYAIFQFFHQDLMAQTIWPEDPKLKLIAENKNAMYSDELKANKYRSAANYLYWLLIHTPNFNPSIYINGIKIYEALADIEKNPVQKLIYVDSALTLYDLRIKYYKNEGSVIDRKAFTAYKYKSDFPEYQEELLALFKKTFELNGSKVMDPNTLLYMNTVRKFQHSNKNKLSDEQVLDIYDNIIAVIDEKMTVQGTTDYAAMVDKIDGILIELVPINCPFIEKNYAPKLKSNPSDIKTAKKIVKYSVTSKCTDSPIFLKAAEIVNAEKPDYGISRLLAIRYKNEGDFEKANLYYHQSLDLAEGKSKKADIYMELAAWGLSRGQKAAARDMAIKAVATDPEKIESAYSFIGDLYMGSYHDCKGGVDIILDKAVILAAYEAYQKAGNTEKMVKTKEYFPSAEEIFNANKKVGEIVTAECWINENVVLQKR